MQLYYLLLTFFVAVSFGGHISEDHDGHQHEEPSRYFGHSSYNSGGGSRYQQQQQPTHYAHQIPTAAIRHTETVGVSKTITPVITKSTTYNTHSEPAISIGHIQGHSHGGVVGVGQVHPVQFNTHYTTYANPTVGIHGPVRYGGAGHEAYAAGGISGAYDKVLVPQQQFQAGLPGAGHHQQIVGQNPGGHLLLQQQQQQQPYIVGSQQPLVQVQAGVGVPLLGHNLYQQQSVGGSYLPHYPQHIFAGHHQQQQQQQFSPTTFAVSGGHFAPAAALYNAGQHASHAPGHFVGGLEHQQQQQIAVHQQLQPVHLHLQQQQLYNHNSFQNIPRFSPHSEPPHNHH